MIDFGYSDFLAGYELAVEFTWNGGTYTGARGDRSEGYALSDGGFGSTSDMVLVCPVAQFGGTTPRHPQTVTVGTATLRIDTVTHSPDGQFVVLNLVAQNRGV